MSSFSTHARNFWCFLTFALSYFDSWSKHLIRHIWKQFNLIKTNLLPLFWVSFLWFSFSRGGLPVVVVLLLPFVSSISLLFHSSDQRLKKLILGSPGIYTAFKPMSKKISINPSWWTGKTWCEHLKYFDFFRLKSIQSTRSVGWK